MISMGGESEAIERTSATETDDMMRRNQTKWGLALLSVGLSITAASIIADQRLGSRLQAEAETSTGGFGSSYWGPELTRGIVFLLVLALVSIAATNLSRLYLRQRFQEASGTQALVIFIVGIVSFSLLGGVFVGSGMWFSREGMELRPVGGSFLDSDETRLLDVLENVLWHLTDSIPAADATALLKWDVPLEYTHWSGGLFLLSAKLIVAAPAFVSIKEAWKDRNPRSYTSKPNE